MYTGIVSGRRVKSAEGLTQRVLAEVSWPAKMSVLTDAMSMSRVYLSMAVVGGIDLLSVRLVAIASSMA
jgi:hypothetical protein